MKLSRRSLLKTAAGLGLFSLLPSFGKSVEPNLSKNIDVIIVGAGVAGLTAARDLQKQGLNVLILEASDQHGGRIKSRTLGSTRIDMGAEEFYLRRNNPIFVATKEDLGLDIFGSMYTGEDFADMGDGTFTNMYSESSQEDKDMSNFKDYLENYYDASSPIDFSLSMADDIANRYQVDAEHPAYHLYENGLAGSSFGTSLDKIGIASLVQQENLWSLSENVVGISSSKLGYQDVLDQVWWQDVLSQVKLNCPVSLIRYTNDGVEVDDSLGNTYAASAVIVTASIGVLQSELIEFEPKLPATTVEAYQGIGMGKGMKVALRFSESFWQEDLSYMITAGVSGSFWIPSNYKKGSPDNILMCFPMGNKAEALSAQAEASGNVEQAKQLIERAMLEDLDLLYKGAASKHFIDSIVQDYTADLYIQGSYSYPLLNTQPSRDTSLRKQLRQAVSGRLFFAGEATNDTASATVPGAALEGERVAAEVYELLGA